MNTATINIQAITAEFIKTFHTDDELEAFYINAIMPFDNRSISEILAPHIFIQDES